MGMTWKAERFFDLPGGALSSEALVEIVGNRQLRVEGFCDIQEYDPSCVRLKTKQGELCIRGDDLRMGSLYAGGALVEGCIVSVEFS